MRWMQARRSNICTGCANTIEKGSDYYGNSYSAFCQKCGELKQQKELVYAKESKSYTNIINKSVCDYCKTPSIGHLNGKTVCSEHIGRAVDLDLD